MTPQEQIKRDVQDLEQSVLRLLVSLANASARSVPQSEFDGIERTHMALGRIIDELEKKDAA